MTNDRDKALEAGADEFDTKPVRFQQLLEKIAALLARTGAAGLPPVSAAAIDGQL
jgi:DNA-binding response OmpR family regulator